MRMLAVRLLKTRLKAPAVSSHPPHSIEPQGQSDSSENILYLLDRKSSQVIQQRTIDREMSGM